LKAFLLAFLVELMWKLRNTLHFVLWLCNLFMPEFASGQENPRLDRSRGWFIENKGQLADQNGKTRPDILCYGSTSGFSYHLRANGISYQFGRVLSVRECKDVRPWLTRIVADCTVVYRVDMHWAGSRSVPAVLGEDRNSSVENYYFPHCPDGVLAVRRYEAVRLNGIYDGIDVRFYREQGDLKYDYLVKAGGKYTQIKTVVSGAEAIKLLADGSVLIKTPILNINEEAPKVFQNNVLLKSNWKVSGDTLSFNIENYDPRLPMTIDPVVRVWGTYFGDSGDDDTRGMKRDADGNIYLCGASTSSVNIVTSGAHQTVFAGGINATGDAYVTKFNSVGVRQWSTYYGGYGTETGNSCAIDSIGNIYLAGYSNTGYAGNAGSVVATPSTYISTYTTGTNGFLVKFNRNGVREWGTYCYGNPVSCVIDRNSDIYIGGQFSTNFSGQGSTLLPTAGAHQTVVGGGFITKFDSLGARIWSTFYGGANAISCLAVDNNNHLYATGQGWTNTGTIVATPGSHQFNYGGFNSDGFLVKFSSGGVRQWATYYGASDDDYGWGVCTDPVGNVYLAGTQVNYYYPYSGTIIATPGSHQSTIGGGSSDAFLVKFNSAGTRQWGTYYGGGGYDQGIGCFADEFGSIYLCGIAASTNNIASSGGYQTTNGGGVYDSFLAKFDNNGFRHWGTFYGGSGFEYANFCVADTSYNVYIGGTTASSAAIGSSGSHQSSYGGGGMDAYMAKFRECTMPAAPVNVTPAQSPLCTGNSATLIVQSNGNIQWFSSATATTPVAIGAVFVTPSLSAGTYTYFAEASMCRDSVNHSRTPVTVTVSSNSVPVLSVSTGSICSGQTFTISPSGASSYTISGGNSVVTPSFTTPYVIMGSNAQGCISASPAVCIVSVSASPTITVPGGRRCTGTVYTISPVGAFTYTITGNSFLVTPTVNTSYSITGTNSAGCLSTNTAVANVTVVQSPTLYAQNATMCLGHTLSLNAWGVNGNYTVSGSSWLVSPTTTTSYTIGALDWTTGCSDTIVLTVTVLPVPQITVNSGSVCAGQAFTISPFGANSYSYSGGTNVVYPSTTTVYTVTGYISGTCSAALTSTVTVRKLPNVSVNGGVICAGNSFTFLPTGAVKYIYYNGGPVVTPQTTKNYTLAGVDSLGCVSSPTTINVTVNPLPLVTVNTGSICQGNSFTIIPSGAWIYTVMGGNAIVSPTVTTSYTIIGMDGNGCISQPPAVSTVLVKNPPLLVVPDGTICVGDVFAISPQGASAYSVSGGSFLVAPLASSTYTIIGKSVAGCVDTAFCHVVVNALPKLSATAIPSLLCIGESATIFASGALTYSLNSFARVFPFVIYPPYSYNYYITGTDLRGCTGTATISIQVYECTGIDKPGNVNKGIMIYPNPSNGIVNIEVGEKTHFLIYDTWGRLIREETITDLRQVRIDDYANGIYFLVFHTSAGCQTTRLIKE
jgi:hypothetical protein